jgi:hypothetical protein
MTSTVRWKPAGQIVTDGTGSLVFPPVPSVKGIYWFSVAKGTKVIAGYRGQAGGKKGLAQRFRGYRSRGITPWYDKHGNLGTTSQNARRLLDALKVGQTVTVFIIDDPAMADDAQRDKLELILIRQLCRSGVVVWNRAGTKIPLPRKD